MTSGGVTKALSQIGVHAACGLLGVPGVVIGPLLAGAAAWGGKHWSKPEEAFVADALGSTLAGILSNLASSAAEGAIASITPERNGDLERAGAAAIQQGLKFGRESSKGGAKRVLTADLEPWFEAWDQRLARGLRKDPEALFRSADAPDPVDWVQADKDTWWAAFEQVLHAVGGGSAVRRGM
ncbi:MAG: hypothetical protein JNL62_09970 [Bryobacterales bacterium]|nr:hypothetical protein [Bryobacterales bacterium]